MLTVFKSKSKSKSKRKSKQSLPSVAPKVHPFFNAIASGDPSKVKQMITKDLDINMHFPGGNRTPLHVATHLGFTSIVSLLITNLADVKELSDDGQTALHVAAQDGRAEMIDVLVKAGAEVDALAKGGYTPLQVAAQDGHPEMIEGLVKAGANINARTELGFTALHESAARGHKNATIKLLELGADPTITDNFHHFTAANLAHGNFHGSIRDIICCKMTYQQSFIQNINYILRTAPYGLDSKQGLFLQKIATAIESIKDSDAVFTILYNAFQSSYYYNELKGTLKPVVPVLIANMHQYNQDKANAKIETSQTNKKDENKSSSTINPLLLSSGPSKSEVGLVVAAAKKPNSGKKSRTSKHYKI